MKTLAIMGGTFDPIHMGHLMIADAVREALSADSVLFIPDGNPPHKSGKGLTSGEHRLAMTRLAVEGNPAFTVSDMEIRREGKTYTIDTIRELKRILPEDTRLYFIIGADSFVEMYSWYHAEELFTMCSFAVVCRPGYSLKMPESDLYRSADFTIVDIPPLDLSSSGIRQRLKEGKTVRYLLPDPVLAYIREHHLYEPDGSEQ